MWLLLLSLLSAGVVAAASVNQCDSNEYPVGDLCCKLCPAGFHVSKHCDKDHPRECSPCPPNTFMAYPNKETECRPCTECRKNDQEVVNDCTRYRDQECQCKNGTHFCDNEECPESCYPCSSCPGSINQTCTPKRDTVCAREPNPEPGNAASDTSHPWLKPLVVAAFVILGIIILGIIIAIYFCRRQGAQLCQRLVSFLKSRSSEPGSRSLESVHSNEKLLPTDPERGPPAPNMEAAPLLEEEGSAMARGAGTHPGPSDYPGEGIELQAMVPEGSQATPEWAPQTHAPAAHGPQGQAKAAASLSELQQEYEEKYILKNTSSGAISRLNYEFIYKVPENDWKMFMRLVGLEEKDIDICEHENQGNLMEQHHKMLLCWKNRLGRDASAFKLLAALRKMELHEPLQNIINSLVAENILGRHEEASN